LKQFISKVIDLKSIADDYFLLTFTWPLKSIPKAGQFLTIRTTELPSPLLRRPFALSSFNDLNKEASIIFQKLGTGTELLSQLKEGEDIDILGPLGNSFSDYSISADTSITNHVVVAGGIGTGPMLYLVEELKKSHLNPLLIIGCRTKSLIPFSVLDKSIETVICTDDGSYGFKGNVIDYMKSNRNLEKRSAIYCCGPEPMLKGCHRFSLESNNKCYVSLEQLMACGIGACMGCTCETEGQKKFARVCKDGPVFKSSEVKWT
jgi:dihydroorotate dehydrogenase electron transfer subunit